MGKRFVKSLLIPTPKLSNNFSFSLELSTGEATVSDRNKGVGEGLERTFQEDRGLKVLEATLLVVISGG
jgi:hypothetical protein